MTRADTAPQGAFSLPADNPLILRPHPFTTDTGVYPVRAGQTLEAMLREASMGRDIGPTLRVEIGGYEVPRQLWAKVKPKAGVPIHCTVMPAGGGRGRKLIRTVLMVALTVWTGGMAAAGWTAFGLSAATTWALVGMVGMLAINALVPPPTPNLGAGVGNAEGPGRWNQLTGSSNQVDRYGAITLILGEHVFFPKHAAIPYTEVLGDTSYQYCMFDLGHDYGGPDDPTVYMEVDQIKIGGTDFAEFSEVEHEITKTPTLYTSDVSEVAASASLNVADEPVSVVRTTDSSIDGISLDIVFPQGLFGYTDQGSEVAATANFTIEYRETGTSTWLTPSDGVRLTGCHGSLSSLSVRGGKKPFAAGVAFKVVNNAASYDVRVTRNSTNWGTASSGNRIGDAQWTVLRSITNTNPSNTGTVKLVVKIKSTDQLNGILQSLSCRVRQKVPVYDPDTETWGAPQLTCNTAWVYAWLIRQCPAFAVHVPDSRADLDGIATYADFCTLHGLETRGVVDSPTTARQLLDEVLGCSMAALTMRDGKYGVLFDDGNTLPSMVFTPLDSRNFRGSRVFTRIPDALRVRFRNPAADWEIDEILVLNDGFSHDGVDARGNPSSDPEPEVFETLELRMCCDAHQAWRVGRFHLAQAKYRPTVYEWETDIANFACTRGDCVHVAHDVPEWGAGAGRVVSLEAGGEGGAAATLVLDEIVTTVAGTSYSVRIRLDDGSSVTAGATPHSVETGTFYLDSLPDGVNAGDGAIIFETARDIAKLLLTGIKPGADFSATVSAVAYSPEVAAYWDNPPVTIPSAVTGITYRDPPAPPDITVVLSSLENEEPDDAGVHQPQVHIRIPRRSGFMPAKYAREAA